MLVHDATQRAKEYPEKPIIKMNEKELTNEFERRPLCQRRVWQRRNPRQRRFAEVLIERRYQDTGTGLGLL